jgi:cold shock CspA family protein
MIGTVTAYHERSGWGWLRAEDGSTVPFSVGTAHKCGTYYLVPGYKLSYRLDGNGHAVGLAYARYVGKVTASNGTSGTIESPQLQRPAVFEGAEFKPGDEVEFDIERERWRERAVNIQLKGTNE